MDINAVLRMNFVRDLIVNICGFDIEIINRKDCFIIRNKNEDEKNIDRIIILPPKGFTANSLNQMNSHDEAEYATIKLHGAVKEGKSGFSKIKNCLLVASICKNSAVSDLNQPYLTYDLDRKNPDFSADLHSAGTPPVPVVRPDGYGFYHNLVNVTDEWLVLKLHKKLRSQKKVNLEKVLASLSKSKENNLKKLYLSVVKYGDNLFKKSPKLVESILQIPMKDSFPVLADMLYIHDSGKHEACTIFAVMLKIGSRDPVTSVALLENFIKEKLIPSYYAYQLIKKIENYQSKQTEEKQLAQLS